MELRKELIDFAKYCAKQGIHDLGYYTTDIVNEYLKSIKGSPQDIKVCYCMTKTCLHHKGGICMAAAWKCKDKQTD